MCRGLEQTDRSALENNVNRPQEMGAWVLINVDWYDDPGSVGEVDLIFLGVKLYDAADAVKALLPMLGPDTGIITLQNGIEAPNIVADIAGPSHAIPGVALVNGEIAGPGHVQHNMMNMVTVGETDGRSSARLEALATLGQRAGINLTISPDS